MPANKPKPPKHRPLSENAIERLIWDRLRHADDRTVAIVGAGFVEHELARAIAARLRILTPSEHNRLFDGYGALSSFAQKIDIGYALRIYDKAERKELEAIKTIRNQFAHSFQTKNFNHPKIRKECLVLLGYRYQTWLGLITNTKRKGRLTRTLRQKFSYSISMMSVMLISGIKRVKRPAIVSELSLATPLFRAWLETGALPVIQVIPNRGSKSEPRMRRPRSSPG